MFWLAGLEAVQQGWLYTFEPNEVWASAARGNLSAIGDRFTLTVGTFEDTMESVLPSRPIDLAFIDAIHTSEFVGPQFELVAARSRPGSLVILDDIDFSEDMHEFWLTLARQPGIRASATLGERVGIVELS
jgi:predicted O-methyltransferase YrrM